MQPTLDETRPGPPTSDVLASEPAPKRLPHPVALVPILVAAVLFDRAAWAEHVGAAAALGCVAMAWCATIDPDLRWRPRRWLPVGIVAALAMWLVIRTSPAVTVPTLMTCAGLVLVLPWTTSVRDLASSRRYDWLQRARDTLLSGPAALPVLVTVFGRSARTSNTRMADRGITPVSVVLSASIGITLTAALASGDAVFGSLFELSPTSNPTPHIVTIAVLAGFGSWLAIAATAAAAPVETGPLSRDDASQGPIPNTTGAREAAVLLSTVTAILAVFTLTQIVTLTQGRQFVVERTGLTFADYARKGFFQLLAAALIVLIAIAVARMMSRADIGRPTSAVVRLVVIDAALTIGLVAVSVHRLSLYEDEFGLTLLRLMSTLFALWLGGVALLVAAATAGPTWLRSHLTASVIGWYLIALIAFAAINPDQVVAQRNIERAREGADLDLGYLAGLSSDAHRVLERELTESEIQTLVSQHWYQQCRLSGRESGWASFNFGHRSSLDWLNEVCGAPSSQQPPDK